MNKYKQSIALSDQKFRYLKVSVIRDDRNWEDERVRCIFQLSNFKFFINQAPIDMHAKVIKTNHYMAEAEPPQYSIDNDASTKWCCWFRQEDGDCDVMYAVFDFEDNMPLLTNDLEFGWYNANDNEFYANRSIFNIRLEVSNNLVSWHAIADWKDIHHFTNANYQLAYKSKILK